MLAIYHHTSEVFVLGVQVTIPHFEKIHRRDLPALHGRQPVY